MKEAVVVEAKRSAIGSIRGSLSLIRADDLMASVMKQTLSSAQLDPSHIDEVILGCANQAGEDNRNIARMATILAGLSYDTPAITVNRLCASGLSAINLAARLIQTGENEVMIAGGVESMSRAPWVMPKSATPFASGNLTAYDTSLGWRFPNPAMEAIFPLEAMGETAENLVDRYGISREDQDIFALKSQQKALTAIQAGAFRDEIVPITIQKSKKEQSIVSQDEGPRADSSIEALSKLNAVFRKGGSVTAGNSSTLNDGACALVLMSKERAIRENREILATIKACASAGVDPRYMGIGPVPATQKALAQANWKLEDLNLIELNEAFAAQALSVIRELKLNEELVNVHGGAIALGHPLGCSGARILTTLIYALRKRGGGKGLASLCVGVGQGVATLIEV
jgi:acetyl-CoA acyltransferase